MKKVLKFTSVLTVVLMMLAMAACGGSAPSSAAPGSDASSGSSAAAAPDSLAFGTGGESGTYYAYGGTLANTLSAKLDGVSIVAQTSGGSKANIISIEDKEIQLGFVQNDVAYYGYTGTDLFESVGACTGFSVIAALYPETCQIISTSDITSIEDLRGKIVSVGDAGSGVEFNANQILDAYGMSFDDIQVTNLSFSASAEALKNGTIDAFFCTAGDPTTAVTELATTNSINLLEIDDEHAAALIEKYPFYTQRVVVAGSYNGIDTDVKTVAVKATLIASNDLPEDLVYSITKGIFDYKDDVTHDKASFIDAAYAVDGISIPFHPGAEKYYKEIGILK